MRFSKAMLMRRLGEMTPTDFVRRATSVLIAQKSTSSRLNPIRSTVAEVLQLWKIREEISRYTGNPIPGVSELNARLRQLSPESEVDQYNFESEMSAGSIFVDPVTGEFLGDTIVDKHDKSQEILDHEAQTFGPSRKSA